MRKVLLGAFFGLVVFFGANLFFSPVQSRLLGIVTTLVYYWSAEVFPLGVVSLLPLILFPLFDIIDLKTTAPNYSKSIIFLFLGGFMLAIAMQKSKLTDVVANKLLDLFPKSARGIIYAIAITAALLSAFLSNTTVTIMLLPIALYLSDNPKLKARYLIALAYGASIGGILTPIGTPPNLILLGFLEDLNIYPPDFIEWIGLTLPVVGSMLLLIPWLLSLGLHDEPIRCECREISLTDDQKKLALILILLVVLLLLNPLMKYMGGFSLNEKLLLLGFGLLLFFPKIELLKWEDSKEIPYEIIFLFGAGFSIATAFIKTGLASAIAKYLAAFAHVPLFVMLLLVALFVSFATEITSNTALTSIILPIIYEFSQSTSINPEILLFSATIAASYAFMLPIATPPNAIVMSSRAIKIKEMGKIGFIVNLLGVLIVSIVGIVLWSGYFG